jgi:hypothetical protein
VDWLRCSLYTGAANTDGDPRKPGIIMACPEVTGNFEDEKLVFISHPYEMGLVFRITFGSKAKGQVAFLREMKNGDNFEKTQEGLFTPRA